MVSLFPIRRKIQNIFLIRLHPNKLCLYRTQPRSLLQVHKNVPLEPPLRQSISFNTFYDIFRVCFQNLRCWTVFSRIFKQKIFFMYLSFPSHVTHIPPLHTPTCRWHHPRCVNNKTAPHYIQFMNSLLFILSRIPILSSAQR